MRFDVANTSRRDIQGALWNRNVVTLPVFLSTGYSKMGGILKGKKAILTAYSSFSGIDTLKGGSLQQLQELLASTSLYLQILRASSSTINTILFYIWPSFRSANIL